MLNEERVKLMVDLACYESKAAGELKISTYETKDYVRVQVLLTTLWVTVSYFLLILLLAMVYAKKILENAAAGIPVLAIGGVLIGYIAILIPYIVVSRRYYKKRYLMAKRNTKRFARNLEKLEKLYEKESV